tara:strand:- start:25086 stop:27539 length:2454 start_codon:yes stop_codon:yes gene_type:complete
MNFLKGTWLDPQSRANKKEVESAVIKMVESIKRQHSIYRKEISEYLAARYLAEVQELPRQKRLQDLYDEIMRDPFIFGRAETRILRISNKKLIIVNEAEEAQDDKTKLLQKGWARQLTKYNLASIYYGYTLPYIKELGEDGLVKKVDMVYRDHIVPETCEILKSPEDRTGERFDEAPYTRWMYFVKTPHSLGLLDKAAPLYIFKKHSWQNWDEFEEKFGIPMRIAKIASQDKAVQREVDKWLKDLGSSSYARFPEGTELDIKETSTTDAFQVFNEKRKAANEELATLFDGHAETVKTGGSQAKVATIMEGTQDLITLDDEAFNLDIWNDEILPLLREQGYPFADGDMVAYDENVASTPEERLKIFTGVTKLGYKVKKEQIETELDVELEDVVEPPTPPPTTTKKEDTENRLPNFNTPHNHGGCGAEYADYRVIDTTIVNADISPDEEKLLKAIYAGNVNWNYNEFSHTHGRLLKGLMKGYGNVGIDYDADDHKMIAAMRGSVHRFGLDKTTAEIFQLNQIIKDPAVDSFAKFRERALKVFPNYNQTWLKTEYQQAFVVGQMSERYQEMVSDIEDAPYWRLVAVLDDGTTTICRGLDGKVFRKDNAETWKFLPPNHWKCRSDAEDVIDANDDEVLDMRGAIGNDPDGFANMQKSGHDVNWGDTGQVFSASQSYLKKVAAVPIEPLDFTYADFGLSKTLKSSLNAPTTAFKYAEKLDDAGRVVLLDVDKMPRWGNQLLFKTLDEKLLNALPNALKTPDEIYWNETVGKMTYTYIKVYKEFTMQVVVEFSRTDSAQIIFINTLTDANEVRKGLLVHDNRK